MSSSCLPLVGEVGGVKGRVRGGSMPSSELAWFGDLTGRDLVCTSVRCNWCVQSSVLELSSLFQQHDVRPEL